MTSCGSMPGGALAAKGRTAQAALGGRLCEHDRWLAGRQRTDGPAHCLPTFMGIERSYERPWAVKSMALDASASFCVARALTFAMS
jgi:hypothetical protein